MLVGKDAYDEFLRDKENLALYDDEVGPTKEFYLEKFQKYVDEEAKKDKK